MRTDFRELLGINVDIEPRLKDSITNFTLVFSRAEQVLMEGNGSIRKTHEYAEELADKLGMDAGIAFDYFRNRYITSIDGESRLDALCPDKPRDRQKVFDAFVKVDPSSKDKMEAVLNVCLRLRHNLFHGNKWQYGLAGQEENLEHATLLLSRCLNRIARL